MAVLPLRYDLDVELERQLREEYKVVRVSVAARKLRALDDREADSSVLRDLVPEGPRFIVFERPRVRAIRRVVLYDAVDDVLLEEYFVRRNHVDGFVAEQVHERIKERLLRIRFETEAPGTNVFELDRTVDYCETFGPCLQVGPAPRYVLDPCRPPGPPEIARGSGRGCRVVVEVDNPWLLLLIAALVRRRQRREILERVGASLPDDVRRRLDPEPR